VHILCKRKVGSDMVNPSLYMYIDSLLIGSALSLIAIGFLIFFKRFIQENSFIYQISIATIVASIVVIGDMAILNPSFLFVREFMLFLLTFITSYVMMFAIKIDYEHIGLVMLPSIIIGIGIVLIHGIVPIMSLFNEGINLNIMLLLSTVSFAILWSFVAIRFIIQVAYSNLKRFHWIIIGSICLGISFISIRYSILISTNIYNLQHDQLSQSLDLSILPFTLIVFSVLTIELVISIMSEKLRNRQQKMYETLLDNSAVAIIVTDNEGFVLNANKTIFKMTGYKDRELIGQSFFEYLYANVEGKERLAEEFYGLTEKDLEVTFNKKNYNKIELNVSFVPIKERNIVTGWYIILKDISEQIQMKKSVDFLTENDLLTGLSNMHTFKKYLQQKIDYKEKMAVLMIDIDRFKRINETKGHQIGDSLLKRISRRLSTCLGDEFFIARTGGDEYSVIIHNYESLTELKKISYKLISAISKPYNIKNEDIFLTSSIGITLFPEDGDSVQQLLKHASTALLRAKEEEERISFYSNEHSAIHDNRFELETELRKANIQKEFKLFYQPQLDLKTGKISGVEALLRWYHPEKGVISPDVFIPIAEEIGLIRKLGEWVIFQACKQNKKWQDDGFPKIRMSINLSMAQFYDKRFIQKLKMILNKTQLDPKYLDIEITESMTMKDLPYSIQKFKKLKSLGVLLSIDDFGKGYSSFHHLKVIPIDRIKIDKSFIKDIEENSDGKAIIGSILSLSKQLRLTSVAEGVENNQQEQILLKLNCNEIQGYYYSPPLQSNEMKRFLSVYR
jgi:diguanylate cyclase